MAYEEYDPRRSVTRSIRPYVTIQRNGRISLGRATWEQLGEPKAVRLFFDRVSKSVHIKASTEYESKSVAVHKAENRKRSSQLAISGSGFVRQFGIDTSVARRYEPSFSDRSLEFRLADGVDVTSSRRK